MVGYGEDGKEITLEDYNKIQKNEFVPSKFKSIREDNKREIALARLNKVKNYGVFRLPRVGRVDKERAIELILENSEHADYLINLELKTIDLMVKRLKSK